MPDQPVCQDIIGGGRRLVEKATGYRFVLASGVVTFVDGPCTGALPGRRPRSAA